MVVHIRLFAALRERAGRDRLELELPEGARVADALAAVDHLAGGLSLVLAVNREYAPGEQTLQAGDELALIPPVSGGAATAPHVAVRDEPLSLDALAAAVRDPRAGAVVTFSGVTRDVDHLDYEAYAEMAAEQIEAIVAAAIERHGAVRGGGRAPRRARSALGGLGHRRRQRTAPRGGLRGRARDHRRDQAPRSDLEARGGRLGGGPDAADRLLAGSVPVRRRVVLGLRRDVVVADEEGHAALVDLGVEDLVVQEPGHVRLEVDGGAVVVDLLVGGLGLLDERELERRAFGRLGARGDADAARLGIVGLGAESWRIASEAMGVRVSIMLRYPRRTS